MILHIDMDAFYCSVEERDRPELVGKPVIVGGTPEGRGVVAAANYEVRKYGVHSAMPAATARRLCPHAVVLPARHSYYAKISHQIREVFHRYTPLVEPLSLDEAFLDVKASEALFGSSAQIGREIKIEIAETLNLVASVGVAPNKFLAKIASDLDKPDGFLVVDPDHVQDFLDPLPVSRLWGIGKVSQKTLHKRGVHTIGALRQLSQAELQKLFGKVGAHLWRLAHGIDDRAVIPDSEAKSISHETTFDVDITDTETLRSWLLELTEQVSRRLRRHQLYGRTVQIKIRFADFRTITRAHTLSEPTHITQEIWCVAAALLEQNLSAKYRGVRLLGIGVSGFADESGQVSLFEQSEREKQGQIDTITDSIKDRFGQTALRRATDLKR